ncbi:MAG: pyrimidine dimer DNA glycosylase/endonuclease V [Methylococcaceae bacterium]
MRMWMVDPALLCDQHLLGEHGELHKFLHNWIKHQPILKRLEGNAMEPLSYKYRHDALAREMVRRGMRHQSPLTQPDFSYLPEEQQAYRIDVEKNMDRLCQRCDTCRERIHTAIALAALQGKTLPYTKNEPQRRYQ